MYMVPWTGQKDHTSETKIRQWIGNCHRNWQTPIYSVQLDSACIPFLELLIPILRSEGGQLAVVWGPNEKEGAALADPTWNSAENDASLMKDYFPQWLGAMKGIPIVSAAADCECYIYQTYVAKGGKLSEPEWKKARAQRYDALNKMMRVGLNLREEVQIAWYGANRAIPQVRRTGATFDISGWGYSPNIDNGQFPAGFCDGNWPHEPSINSAAIAATVWRSKAPIHVTTWIGIKRDLVDGDCAYIVDDLSKIREGAKFIRHFNRYIDTVWVYKSLGAKGINQLKVPLSMTFQGSAWTLEMHDAHQTDLERYFMKEVYGTH